MAFQSFDQLCVLHLVVVACIAVTASAARAEAEPSIDELLLQGSYDRIPVGKTAHEKAVWVFAQYHLAPTATVYEAALEAHGKKEELGTFVVLRCHQEGRAVRRDEKLMHQLNYALRQQLLAIKNPTPVQMFLLSQTSVANAEGVIQLPDGQKLVDFQREEEKQHSDRLRAAAAGGFAQACGQIGQDYQKAKEDKKAYEWFAKAAKLGLASGMKDQGFLLFSGRGVERDAEEGLKITRQAADRGDIFAMLNMAAFYARGLGVDKDQETARQWLDKAVKSGNYWGRLEKSLALATGRYGYKPDKKAAVQEMGRALETRNREVLEVLASWYVEGEIVDGNWTKAAELAEAAFVQGSTQAAPLLAHVYGKGGAGLKKDEKLAEYWKIQANASLAFVLEKTESHPEITKRLKQLDPWTIQLE